MRINLRSNTVDYSYKSRRTGSYIYDIVTHDRRVDDVDVSLIQSIDK